VLAEWRLADADKRRSLLSAYPSLYQGLVGEELHRDIARIETGVQMAAEGLRLGMLPQKTAAALLSTIRSDLSIVFGNAMNLERKLEKVKKRARK
jgi:hypothetical protein